MQTSERYRDTNSRSFAARQAHLPNLSISNDAHHVTEAIGYMYEDQESPTSSRSARDIPRLDKPLPAEYDAKARRSALSARQPLGETKLNGNQLGPHSQNARPGVQQAFSFERSNGSGGMSFETREPPSNDAAITPFPLNNHDYESSPAAVAQELSNLQALRRMSMDQAAAGDPDLPQLKMAAIPRPPSADSSEDDSSRLFWVPASLHPELAPKEFKTFLDSKAEQIKRRSGELSQFGTLSLPDFTSNADMSGGLRRKTSMLSKQINNSVGYQDGAERLEEKRTRERRGALLEPPLEELEALVAEQFPAQRESAELKQEDANGDIILPTASGASLKRSTRTKYQRSDSQRTRPDRSTFAQRAARKAATTPAEPTTSIAITSSTTDAPSLPVIPTETLDLAPTLKYSTLNRTSLSRLGDRSSSPPKVDVPEEQAKPFESVTFSRLSSNELKSQPQPPTAPITRQHSEQPSKQLEQTTIRPVPQIIESPPSAVPDDRPTRSSSMRPPRAQSYTIPSSTVSPQAETPSEEPKRAPPTRPNLTAKQSSSTTLVSSRSKQPSQALPPPNTPSQTLEQPSTLPSDDTNTSNLSYIPTLTVDKKAELKRKDDKKSSWSWLLGKEENDRERERARAKGAKSPQNHDSTRLDVLQTSIDGGSKGRESLVLDRESLKLEEERKKESQRKAAPSNEKKEGIFSSIFGGKKNKPEKETHKKYQDRLSPEPPRESRPDVDYNWTRFSILEERAIYRMAHMKLANPRRALYSQMHPQMNLPTSAKQQRKQKEQQAAQQQQLIQQQQQHQQPDEYAQYQRYHQHQARQETHQQTLLEQQGIYQSHDSKSSSRHESSSSHHTSYSHSSPYTSRSSHSHSSSRSSGGGDPSLPMAYAGASALNNHYAAQQRAQQQQQQQQQQQHHPRPKPRRSNRRKDDEDDFLDDDDDMW